MNDNHSTSESKYKKRWMTPLLRQASKDHPVVVLSGARQVGKSTLLREADPFSGWRSATLDNDDTRERADKDPESLWAGTGQIVIDEVQRSPSLLSAVKEAVDRRNRSIRFALSGSANLLLMQTVAESLAGRAVYLNQLPMTYGERASRPPSGLLDTLFSGQFPEEGPVDPPGETTAELMLRGFFPPSRHCPGPPGSWAGGKGPSPPTSSGICVRSLPWTLLRISGESWRRWPSGAETS